MHRPADGCAEASVSVVSQARSSSVRAAIDHMHLVRATCCYTLAHSCYHHLVLHACMLQSEKDGTGPRPGLLVPYRHENNFFPSGIVRRHVSCRERPDHSRLMGSGDSTSISRETEVTLLEYYCNMYCSIVHARCGGGNIGSERSFDDHVHV
jgi:hypothetical protein